MTVIKWASQTSCWCCFYLWKEKKERRKSNCSNASLLKAMFVTVLGSIFVSFDYCANFPVLFPFHCQYFFLWTVWLWQNLPSSLPLFFSLPPSHPSLCTTAPLFIASPSLVLNYLFSLHRPRPRSPNVFLSPSLIFLSRHFYFPFSKSGVNLSWTCCFCSHRLYQSRKCYCKYWKGSDKNIDLATFCLLLLFTVGQNQGLWNFVRYEFLLAHVDLGLWKFLDFKMHRDVDLENSVSKQTEHNRESAAHVDCWLSGLS